MAGPCCRHHLKSLPNEDNSFHPVVPVAIGEEVA